MWLTGGIASDGAGPHFEVDGPFFIDQETHFSLDATSLLHHHVCVFHCGIHNYQGRRRK